jgi:hypothetical protein
MYLIELRTAKKDVGDIIGKVRIQIKEKTVVNTKIVGRLRLYKSNLPLSQPPSIADTRSLGEMSIETKRR